MFKESKKFRSLRGRLYLENWIFLYDFGMGGTIHIQIDLLKHSIYQVLKVENLQMMNYNEHRKIKRGKK